MFTGSSVEELQAAEVVRPGSTRPLASTADPASLATWMTTNQLQSDIRSEQRQRAELAQKVLSLEEQLREAREEANREMGASMRQRERCEEAEARAAQLARDKKKLQREVRRLQEQLGRSTGSPRDTTECDDCNKALASTVARFRQHQRVWVRERQNMARAAQEMGTNAVDKEHELESAAREIDKLQREMERAMLMAQQELGERDDAVARLEAELEDTRGQVGKASELLARSEKERLSQRTTLQQLEGQIAGSATEAARAEEAARVAQNELRELAPTRQRAAVLEAEKAALARELEVARAHHKQLLSVKHEECATTQRRLETANERTKKALSEAEAATAALNAARAEHAEAMRMESSRATQRHTALQAELEQATAEVTTLSGQVEAARAEGEASVAREAAKAAAANLAMRAELERQSEESLREALALASARANEAKLSAVAAVESKMREEMRSREMERSAEDARSRAAAVAAQQHLANQQALSSYSAELTALRDSLGAKRGALLGRDGVGSAGGSVGVSGKLAVSAWEGGLRLGAGGAQRGADIAGVQLRTMRQQFLPKAGHATAEEGVAPAASTGVEAGAVAVKGE